MTTENNNLKIEKLALDGASKKDVASLTLILEETQHRNSVLRDELSAQLANQKELQAQLNQWWSTKRSPDPVSTYQKAVEKLEQEVFDLRKTKELLKRQFKELNDSNKSARQQLLMYISLFYLLSICIFLSYKSRKTDFSLFFSVGLTLFID